MSTEPNNQREIDAAIAAMAGRPGWVPWLARELNAEEFFAIAGYTPTCAVIHNYQAIDDSIWEWTGLQQAQMLMTAGTPPAFMRFVNAGEITKTATGDDTFVMQIDRMYGLVRSMRYLLANYLGCYGVPPADAGGMLWVLTPHNSVVRQAQRPCYAAVTSLGSLQMPRRPVQASALITIHDVSVNCQIIRAPIGLRYTGVPANLQAPSSHSLRTPLRAAAFATAAAPQRRARNIVLRDQGV